MDAPGLLPVLPRDRPPSRTSGEAVGSLSAPLAPAAWNIPASPHLLKPHPAQAHGAWVRDTEAEILDSPFAR